MEIVECNGGVEMRVGRFIYSVVFWNLARQDGMNGRSRHVVMQFRLRVCFLPYWEVDIGVLRKGRKGELRCCV